MQWVEGWTVAALFDRHVTQLGAFPIDEAVEIAWQALAGLEAARRIGLVHRDIKPLNLMVTPPPERQVKVMDFGIAKDVLAAATGDNTQVGTLAYMAPEQFTGAAVDTRTDVYALGVTLYELLAGQRPFLGPTPAAYVRQHLYEAPLPLRELRPEVDAALGEVVHRALARRPEDRFQLPTEMQAALRPFNSPALKLTLPADAAGSLYAEGAARAKAEDLTLASGPFEQTEQRRPVDQDAITRLPSTGTTIDKEVERPISGRGWGMVAVATCALVVGVVLVGWLWSSWSAQNPTAPTSTTTPATTLAPLVAPTTAPTADLATSSVSKATPAATVAPAIAKPTVPGPSANWQVIVDGLGQPNGVAVDEPGNIYVANSENNRIQKLSAAGQLLFEWGSDWGHSAGQFEAPQDVAVDAQGNVYVADRDNDRIQKLSAAGQPLAQWGTAGRGPGQFSNPTGVAVDGQGNVYVTDRANARVQKLSAAGQPLAQWGTFGSGSGPGQFSNPFGVAVDAQGNVYVVDRDHNRIQKLQVAN